ncbi:MAG: hypothetical protein ACI4L6_01435 [Candidatus Onthoplasma sp.]
METWKGIEYSESVRRKFCNDAILLVFDGEDYYLKFVNQSSIPSEASEDDSINISFLHELDNGLIYSQGVKDKYLSILFWNKDGELIVDTKMFGEGNFYNYSIDGDTFILQNLTKNETISYDINKKYDEKKNKTSSLNNKKLEENKEISQLPLPIPELQTKTDKVDEDYNAQKIENSDYYKVVEETVEEGKKLNFLYFKETKKYVSLSKNSLLQKYSSGVLISSLNNDRYYFYDNFGNYVFGQRLNRTAKITVGNEIVKVEYKKFNKDGEVEQINDTYQIPNRIKEESNFDLLY